ncbi:MAG: EcsC family protein [Litoreibacter sp.]
MKKEIILPPPVPATPSLESQITDLAQRYNEARGVGMQLLGLIGSKADTLLDRLPRPAKDALDVTTLRALEASFDTAAKSRDLMPDTSNWLTRAVTMSTGAAGGVGGLPTALAELPVTTTILLRAIQGIASDYEFDVRDADTRADCLQVFAAAGPLNDDDGTDLAFLSLKVSLTGASLQKLIATVAPKLALVMGQKLATQTVPVLGAVAGAATNYVFTSYYQDMAHVQFGLRRLAEDTGHDRAALIERLRVEIESKRAAKLNLL